MLFSIVIELFIQWGGEGESVWIIRLLYPLRVSSQFIPGRKVSFLVKTNFFPWKGKKYPFTRKKPNPEVQSIHV